MHICSLLLLCLLLRCLRPLHLVRSPCFLSGCLGLGLPLHLQGLGHLLRGGLRHLLRVGHLLLSSLLPSRHLGSEAAGGSRGVCCLSLLGLCMRHLLVRACLGGLCLRDLLLG